MVMGNDLVIATLVVVTIIVRGVLRCRLFLVTSGPNEVDRLVVQYFLLLVGGEVQGLAALQDD